MESAPQSPSILRIGAPERADVEAMIDVLGPAPFSYDAVGATRGPLPDGWDHDVLTEEIGRGEDLFERAVAALRAWRMFDLGWVVPHRDDIPQTAGQILAFTARTFGVWSINVCRVVYQIDEDDDAGRRVGFGYGTLPGHVLAGEEAFELLWDRRTDQVSMTVRKFSRPNHPLIRLGGPLIRDVQARFSRQAIAAIARAANAAA